MFSPTPSSTQFLELLHVTVKIRLQCTCCRNHSEVVLKSYLTLTPIATRINDILLLSFLSCQCSCFLKICVRKAYLFYSPKQFRQTFIVSSLLALWPSGLGNCFVCNRLPVQILLCLLEFVIRINLLHSTIAFLYFSIHSSIRVCTENTFI